MIRFLRVLLMCLCVWFPNFIFAQLLLRGNVQDATSKTPVPGASVFLSNTSVGTVTNSKGDFELAVPAGRYDLIVSSIGFETGNQTINTTEQTGRLAIALQPKVKELENVVVGGFEKDGWAQWGTFFLESFIGRSAFARNCVIKNKNVIRFRNAKKEGVLSAIALEPLVIENKALGYTIRYQLETFTYDFNTRLLLFQGYPFFEPMKGSAAQQRRWQARRIATYEGSLMHFMRAVYRNALPQQGFEVHTLKKKTNDERKRVQRLYQTGANKAFQSNKDSAAYYEKILQQPAEFNFIAKGELPGDSIAYALDSVTAALDFPDYLLVIYKKGVAAPEFRQQFPDAGAAMASQIQLMRDRPIAIQSSGNFYEPADLLMSGYWSWSEKIATLLPFDFKASSP